MKRNVVSENELISLLNVELRKYDECKDCQFDSILKLRVPDKKGCNWSSAYLRCSGVAPDECKPFVSEILSEAKAKYNIK